MDTIKSIFLEAPNDTIDPSMLCIVERWNDEPSALQYFELLDNCVHTRGATPFVIRMIEALMFQAMKNEGVTHWQLLEQATWRNA